MITVKIADLAIAIDNRFPEIEFMARDYLTTGAPLFTVFVTDSEIEEERSNSKTNYRIGYYEALLAYRHIAERLPEYDAYVLHGAVIEVSGKAYSFTARSGVGKTTHIRLWLSEFSDAEILNGDKPIIRIIDGTPYAFGNPWQGKENYGRNAKAPLAAITLVNRGEENSVKPITIDEALLFFMGQIYLPRKNQSALAKTLLLARNTLESVGLFSLFCNMDPGAAHVARRGIIGDI